MRTTLNLEDEVLGEVRRYARERSLPVGKAVSLLVRRGLGRRHATRTVNGLQVFDLPADSPRLTSNEWNG